MTVTVKHSKTNAISDWTQAQLDEQIELGNFAPGTTLADIVLPSDWNNDHTFTGTLDVTNGGTGVSTLTGYVKGSGTSAFTASATIPNTDITGLGTISTQDANNVAITGGTINGTTIGATTASTGKFTTLEIVNAGANAGLTLLRNTDSSTNSTRLFMDGSSGVTAIYNSANSIFFNTSATIGTTSGNNQFRVAPTSSAVNYVQVTGAATTVRPLISVQGSDTNIGMTYGAKGTGIHAFTNGNGTQLVLQAGSTSSVNRIEITPTVTGSAPILSAGGTDTNIDLALTPKGTGVLRFGTLTATTDTAISGYITIKDSGGTTRKLAVIT
jgi:hypothetical protein